MDQNNDECASPMISQEFTHHIITFKTNEVYIDKKLFSLDTIVNQVVPIIAENDNVCFNA